VKIGFVAVLQLIAILSVNLAIINILPLPALDGGRILFIIIEAIARKRIIKEKVESVIHAIGFALLLGIIVLVTYNDIAKIIAK
jgi:regulator of sigma E protease